MQEKYKINRVMLLYQKTSSMSNRTSAAIVKNIVMAYLGVSYRKITLGNTISPDWVGKKTTGISYMDYSKCGDLEVFAWSPEFGFIDIDECVEHKSMWHGNHESETTEGIPLCEAIDDKFLFIIVGNGKDDDIHYTVYKTPNFKLHCEQIEEQLTKKWDEWLRS